MRNLAFCALLGVLFTSASAQVWGSFDSTRINYPGGTLDGTEHDGLRAAITGQGGTIAAGTPTLTAAYLSGVDVFYTSLLNTGTGVLSGAEQTDLQNWITAGGTLIVTADIFPLPAYESFTSVYGVTNYTAIGQSGPGNVVANHAITNGVTQYGFTTNSGFTYGGDALLLGDDGSGSDFLIVMEPGTGFNSGGRIAVFGDHNMFTDTFIGTFDNTLLANNMAAWANVVPEPGSLIALCVGLAALALRRRR